jgi:hypothetical protein
MLSASGYRALEQPRLRIGTGVTIWATRRTDTISFIQKSELTPCFTGLRADPTAALL